MSKRLVNYIEKSAEKITKQYFQADVVNRAIVEEELRMNQEIIISMNMTGEIDGLILVGMRQNDAMYLAKKVMELQGFGDLEGWDEFSQSAILEYVNEVMGYVTELLSEDKMIADITIPKFANKEMFEGIKKQVSSFDTEVEKDGRMVTMQFKIYQP